MKICFRDIIVPLFMVTVSFQLLGCFEGDPQESDLPTALGDPYSRSEHDESEVSSSSHQTSSITNSHTFLSSSSLSSASYLSPDSLKIENVQICDFDSIASLLKCDEKDYKTKTFQGRTWMAENLSFTQENGSSCCTAGGCEEVGRLYTWETAVGHSWDSTLRVPEGHTRGICPSGWHIPSDEEWADLEDYLKIYVPRSQTDENCETEIATLLKDSIGWEGESIVQSTNEFEFNIIGLGFRSGISCQSSGEHTYFWSSTPTSHHKAKARGFHNNNSSICKYSFGIIDFLSVRCIKDY